MENGHSLSKGTSFMLLLGRMCLAAIFIASGIGKCTAYEETAAYMAAAGMMWIPFFLLAAALLEIVGGFALLLGCRARLGAGFLFLFLIPASLIFHNFWQIPPELVKMQLIQFMKNLAIEGGLLYAMATGPGRYSIDFYRAAHQQPLK